MGGRMEWGECFSVWYWLLWKLRCSRILDEDFLEREGIYDRGCRLLAECESTFGVTVALARELHRRQRWVGSARGWVKLNVDAAVGATDDRASVGGVIRDANGSAMAWRIPWLLWVGILDGRVRLFLSLQGPLCTDWMLSGNSGCRPARCSAWWMIREDDGSGCFGACLERQQWLP
ncbi:hypothetical protein V6N12_003527 [Hibiscus sabdariffa]|uniref:RNase H type-1 domain-containing protein n=1 Tax=Hibiscus sabdariffa TaxID=183260 RepID=A0ABR2ARR1_9ROSI